MLYWEDWAEDGSKGRRKDLRRDIRQTLGTSSDAAPTVEQALRAANKLQALLDLASGGTYGLAVVELRKIPGARARGEALPTKTISETIGETRALQNERRARAGLPALNS